MRLTAPLNVLFVSVSALRHPYTSSKVTQVRMFRYHAAFDTRWFSFSKFFFNRKFTVRTMRHVFIFSWKHSSRPWRFQWPVSRKAVLFREFISAVNSTNYSSYRVALSTTIDKETTCTWMLLTMISFLVRDFCHWTTYQPLFVAVG